MKVVVTRGAGGAEYRIDTQGPEPYCFVIVETEGAPAGEAWDCLPRPMALRFATLFVEKGVARSVTLVGADPMDDDDWPVKAKAVGLLLGGDAEWRQVLWSVVRRFEESGWLS